ncbi:MAG: undecaprenyl-diphosphatase [Rhodospirillaceae bacterium]|nr:undecaprenyl-diphosphatase [Rhodospirillaceae bacterium]|tara:strand:+ start:6052 stop:6879 length:828 start_codon:yes stop_codon:yes gene_type:complete
MPILHIFILSAVQGITEFLPISSSGHLQMLPMISNLEKQTVLIDVSVHLGTLGGVIIFFFKDITKILNGFSNILKGKKSADGKILIMIVVATIPLIIVGGIVWITNSVYLFRSIEIIAWTTLLFGILLYISDKFFLTVRNIETITTFQAIIFGLAQVISIIPGTSRSGIIITFARFFGYKRTDSAKFAMLLSIPAIILPGILSTLEILSSESIKLQHDFFISLFVSFIFSLIALSLLMRWLKKSSFFPFAFYRIIIGILMLVWIYSFNKEQLFFI